MAYKKDAFERSSAIATNMHHIERQSVELNVLISDDEIFKAAKWMYNTYGYGKCSLFDYLNRANKSTGKRLYNTNVKLWYAIIKQAFERDNYTCVYCGAVGGKLEGDHIIPFSKGGTNDISNIATSCRKCNRQKKDKTVSDFEAWKLNKKLKNISNGKI